MLRATRARITKYFRRASYEKMAENFQIQEQKENSENQNTTKSASTWLNVWTS